MSNRLIHTGKKNKLARGIGQVYLVNRCDKRCLRLQYKATPPACIQTAICPNSSDILVGTGA